MAEPDFWIPETFQLNQDVRAIETSPNNPKVRMDETGLFVTDSAGNKVTQLRAPGGAIDIVPGTSASPPSERRVRFIDLVGNVISQIWAYAIGNVLSELFITSESTDQSEIFIQAKRTNSQPPEARLSLVNKDILVPSGDEIREIRAQIDGTAGEQSQDKLIIGLLNGAPKSDFVMQGSWGRVIVTALSWAIPAVAAGGGFISGAVSTGYPFAGAAVRIGFGNVGTGLFGLPAYTLSNVGGNLNIAIAVNNLGAAGAPASTVTALVFIFYA